MVLKDINVECKAFRNTQSLCEDVKRSGRLQFVLLVQALDSRHHLLSVNFPCDLLLLYVIESSFLLVII
jgi:hypothetical protein